MERLHDSEVQCLWETGIQYMQETDVYCLPETGTRYL